MLQEIKRKQLKLRFFLSYANSGTPPRGDYSGKVCVLAIGVHTPFKAPIFRGYGVMPVGVPLFIEPFPTVRNRAEVEVDHPYPSRMARLRCWG